METKPGRRPLRVGATLIARCALVLLAGLSITPLVHAAARPIFPNPGYTVGAIPIALASGDFNRDGIRDIAVVNRDSEDLSVLIGLGGGAFRPEKRYAMPDIPVDVLTADLNGDGVDDLVVVFPRLDGIGVMRSNGAGQFGPVTLVPTGDSPSALATGDFNADGHADLAVTHFFGETRVLLGDGGGGLGSPHAFQAGLHSSDIAVADIDRDGRLDMLVANAGSNDLSVYMGAGGGNFGVLPSVPTGPSNSYFHPVKLVTHDFNEDGIPDVLFVGFNNTDEINSVETLEGHGDGTFGTGSFVAMLADGQVGVAIGDLDDDGHDDLALTFRHGAICCFHNSGDVYHGSGHGTFEKVESFQTGIAPVALLQDDFDRDGREDVAALSHYPGIVTVLLGQGTGVLGVRVPELVAPSAYVFAVDDLISEDLSVDDLDGDGNPDLLPGYGSAAELSVFYGRGDGSFSPRQRLATAGSPAGALVVDVDGDERRDIVVAIDGPLPGLYLHRGVGGRVFAPAVWIAPIAGPRAIRTLKLDHDDLPDLAVLSQDESRQVLLVRNLGGGAFATPVLLPINAIPRMFATGDLNGDGLSDLVIATGSGEALVLTGLGGGAFSLPQSLAGVAYTVMLIDMNGDGHLDLVGNNFGSISNWSGHGDATFGAPVVLRDAGWIQEMLVSDFNGDGNEDIAFAPGGDAHNEIGILPGGSNGTLGQATYYLSQAPGLEFLTAVFSAADFDHDSRMDLVLAYPTGFGDLALAVILNQGSFPNHAPRAEATAVSSVECTSAAGAAVLLNGAASSDPDSTPGTADDIASYEWFEDFSLPARRLVGQGPLLTTTLPMGDHALTLRVTDQAGAASTGDVVVRVVDTTAPGATLRLTPDRLWPANHKMVEVQALLSASDACGETQVILQSVTSSEPDGSVDPGDHVTLGDVSDATIGTADFGFRLRAERLGNGTGRVYTVRYLVTDGAGNGMVVEATATVPRSQGGGVPPSSSRGGRRPAHGPKSPRPRN